MAFATVSCRDHPLGPNDEPRPAPIEVAPPVAQSFGEGGFTMFSSIAIPSINSPDEGELGWTSTGMEISEDKTYARITVDGTVSVGTHPDYFWYTGMNGALSGNAFGPGGVGNELRVSVRLVDTLGSQANSWNANGDSTWSVANRFQPGQFQVRRTGAALSAGCVDLFEPYTCPGGQPVWQTPGYTFSSGQTFTLETFEPIETDFPSGEVPFGDTVTATITAHEYVDSIYGTYWYYRLGDTLPEAYGSGNLWLLGECGIGTLTCSFVPPGSGRLYVNVTVGLAGAFAERVWSDPIFSDTVFNREIRLTPLDGDWEVYPYLPTGVQEDHDRLIEVAVVGHGNQPVSGHSVTLALDGDGGSAGHSHPDSSRTPVEMPPGTLDAQPSTSATGVDTVLYSASVFSGQVTITATSDSLPPEYQVVTVRFPGLVEYTGTANDVLIGYTNKHPGNHYGSAQMVAALAGLSAAFYERYEVKLGYNDMSLAWGGKFEVDTLAGYDPDIAHKEHRAGESTDLRINYWPEDHFLSAGYHNPTPSGKWLMEWWQAQGGFVLDETHLFHYHLKLPGDSRR